MPGSAMRWVKVLAAPLLLAGLMAGCALLSHPKTRPYAAAQPRGELCALTEGTRPVTRSAA
jgi:hypothetical protein